MPSIKCRMCRIAKQSIMIEAVEPENEKVVLHVRYCAIAVVVFLIQSIF